MIKLKALLYLLKTGEPASLSTLLKSACCTYFQAYIAMEGLEKEGIVTKTNLNFRPVYSVSEGGAVYNYMLQEEFFDSFLRYTSEKKEVFPFKEARKSFCELFPKSLQKTAETRFSNLINNRVQVGLMFRKDGNYSFVSDSFKVVECGLTITTVEVPKPKKDLLKPCITDKPKVPNPHKIFYKTPQAKGKPGSERFIVEKRVLEKMDPDDVFWYKSYWVISSLMTHHLKTKKPSDGFSVDHADAITKFLDEAIDPRNLQILTYRDNSDKGDESWVRMSLEEQKDYLRKAVLANRGSLRKREAKFMEWVLSGLDLLFEEDEDE